MGIFKYLIGFIFAANPMENPEGDGWFPVEKVPKVEEVAADVDPSIWVLFTKKLGSEKFSVRLPDDPAYRSIEGGFILRVNKGGEIFEVSAREGKIESSSEKSLYELDGKWVHEKVVYTGKHTFKLRTFSNTPISPNHELFVSSFSTFS